MSLVFLRFILSFDAEVSLNLENEDEVAERLS